MIARLSGILLDKNPPLMVIDVNGVGYEVEAPLGVFTGFVITSYSIHYTKLYEACKHFASNSPTVISVMLPPSIFVMSLQGLWVE